MGSIPAGYISYNYSEPHLKNYNKFKLLEVWGMNIKKSNLTFSAVGFVASMLVLLYLIMNAPNMMELIIVFGLIALADTYFLVDSIVKKVDEVTKVSLDKQTELVKVEKGIYSVAKREETTNVKQHNALVEQNAIQHSALIEQTAEQHNALLEQIDYLRTENERLHAELVEQQKICTKILVKKAQENNSKTLNSSERLSKLLVQLNGNTISSSKDTLEILEEINKTLDSYYNDSNNNNNDNVRRMNA